MAAANIRVNSSATFSCTRNRLAAVQVSAECRILATIAPWTAASRSASSNTMNGALPPSSITVLSTRSAASLQQDDADFGRPGERHHARRRVVDRGVEPRARRQRRHDVDDTGGKAGLVQELTDPQRRQRCLAWRLDHRCVAGGEGRGELARDHRRGEVPWRDDHDDADGRVVHDDPVGARRSDAERPVDANGLLGVPAEELGGVRDLAAGVGERLAVFERDQPGELVGVLDHQLPGAPEDLTALARGGGGPRRLRLGRSLTRCGGIRRRACRDGRDHLLVRRVLDVEALRARTVAPLATDQQLRLHAHIMHRCGPRRSTPPHQAQRPSLSPGPRPLVTSW